jgi:hypothetical protein
VVQSRSLKGQGRSLVFSSHGVSGSALVAGDGLVHLCAHKRCWGLGQPLAAQRGQLDASCSAWQNERAEYLDRLERDYAGRRRRYLDYVSRLVPSPVAEPIARPRPAADPAAPPARPAARPLPLSRNLHRLFLRLFDRAP